MSPPQKFSHRLFVFASLVLATTVGLAAQSIHAQSLNYFKDQVRQIDASNAVAMSSLDEWQKRRPGLRREAAEMLGLDPMPQRTPLQPMITGSLEGKDFTVQKIAFQSLPGLYVTGSLYLPKGQQRPAPTILYLCGHLAVVSNGISYGCKTAYQHHGIWFAQNGYVCFIIDTLELGEIQGHHKGTYDLGLWWWNSRGYTPAGVETWNAIRALDYLASRPEVDADRLGVTGRSGGGAYSWFLAALDDRVKVIAPVAGMADLQSYAIDGTVDSHCDCMFLVNTYRWDYPLLAALCAPRPLLLANSDVDALFPLDGVMRLHEKIKQVYNLYGASTNFGLVIAPGPHRDTQDLQVPVMRWFNIHLKHKDPVIDTAAVKMFSPQQLRVFDRIPADEINTKIEETFIPEAPVPHVPTNAEDWHRLQSAWMEKLRAKCFAGWPEDAPVPMLKQMYSGSSDNYDRAIYEFHSQPDVLVDVWIAKQHGATGPRQIEMYVAQMPGSGSTNMEVAFNTFVPNWRKLVADNIEVAIFFPRDTELKIPNETGLRRRYMLIGQTLDGMRVWDIRRAVQALESPSVPLWIKADGNLGVDALYASLFENQIAGLELCDIPASHFAGPDYLNVLRILDIPEAAAMAAEKCELRLPSSSVTAWNFLRDMAAAPYGHLHLKWEK
jgi:dienelactone hydrolase